MKARHPFLDGIRGLAALYVVLHHAFMQVWPAHWSLAYLPPLPIMVCLGWLCYGRWAVDIFIVLSGFCLMLPAAETGDLKGGPIGFYKRRARRIMPPYWAALVLSALVIWGLLPGGPAPHHDLHGPITLGLVLSNALFVQDICHSTTINTALWFMAFEFKMYLLLPALLSAGRSLGRVPVFALCALLGLVAAVQMDGWTRQFLVFLALFCLGCLTAIWTSCRGALRLPGAIYGLYGALLVAACYLDGPRRGSAGDGFVDILVGIGASALILRLLDARPSRARAFLERPSVLALGGMSYSLYLIHAPLLQVMWRLVSPLPPLGQFVALAGPGAMLIILAAFLFHRCFERPFLRRG